MHKALLVDHDADVVLARAGLEEDQITRLGMAAQRGCRSLLLRRDARNAHASRLMGNQGQTTAIERPMRRSPAIDIGGANLRQRRLDDVCSCRLETAEIEGLAGNLDAAIRRGRSTSTAKQNQG